MEIFFDTILMYRNTDVMKYSQSVRQLLEVSLNQNNQYYYSIGLRELGFYHIIKSEYDSALFFLDQSQAIVEKLEDDLLMLKVLNFKGLASIYTFDYFSAIQYYQNTNSIAKKLGRSGDVLNSYEMIGEIYKRCKDYEKAIEYYELSSPIIYESETFIERDGWWNLNFGEIHFFKKDYELAEYHYQKSLSHWQKMEMKRGMVFTYNNFGELFFEIKSDKCFENYYQSIEKNESININSELVESYVGLGNSYKIINENLDSASYYYHKAINIGVKNNLRYLLIPALDFFIEEPEYQEILNLSYKDLLDVKNKATEEFFKRSSNQDLKILASMDKIKAAELNHSNSLDKTKMYKRIFLLLLLLTISIIAFLVMLFLKNKKLKESQSQIKSQFELIQKQALVLEKTNQQLVENNFSLKENLSINNLELLHSKGILKNIEKASKEEKSIEINSIIKSEISHSDLNKDSDKSLKSYREKDLVQKLSSSDLKLNDKEITICCMIKLGLTTKEIANISHHSHDSLKVTRSRIRKKLKLDRSENLTMFLNKL